ncbi:MAG: zinc-binding dehydrogenase [Deltaproteobacteria bacterium]|nr:zinc-binding dehydrogenase [Deltaproteobacteria bacterium]
MTGPGPIGLLSLAVAKAAGATFVAVCGVRSDRGIRFDKAKELGADVIIEVDEENPVKKVFILSGNLGVDMVIEASGSPVAITQSFEMVRRTGRICAIGISGKSSLSIPYDLGIFKAIRYDFCFSSSWTAWERCLSLVSKGFINPEKLITHVMPLDKWQEAFQLLEQRQALKVILVP